MKNNDGKNLPLYITGLPVSARALFIASKFCNNKNTSILIITDNERKARQLCRDINVFNPNMKAVFFPEREYYNPKADITASRDFIDARLAVLAGLVCEKDVKIVVTSAVAAGELTFSPVEIKEYSLGILQGASLNLHKLAETLTKIGYERNDTVIAKGQFAVRGGIFDVFPIHSETPFRIELWGDNVDSISSFDVETQRRVDTVKSILISPATETGRSATLFDYTETVIICEKTSIIQAYDSDEDSKDHLPKKQFEKLINTRVDYIFDTFAHSGMELAGFINAESRPLSAWSGEYSVLVDELRDYISEGYTICLFAGSEKSAKMLSFDLIRENFRTNFVLASKKHEIILRNIYVFEGTLSESIDFPEDKIIFLTHTGAETKILGGSASNISAQVTKQKKKKNSLSNLSEINEGDYIVHQNYGIAIFIGVKKITSENIERDYIQLKYAGKDILYIPVTNLNMLSRYVGGGSSEVKLSNLHTGSWARTKQQAKESAEELAEELIEIYKKRSGAKGFEFLPDDERQYEFENRFPYVETEDQLISSAEIKKDMESDKPMERLLCGDVGFGKTEVALRAAYKAICAGKQVALLCPTTVLAWQHYKTALKRFEGLNKNIELLSRFRSSAESKIIKDKLLKGQIDLLIGTHQLIGNSVKFRDLGLFIIDEEQRFGVLQKDKLKEAYPFVDCLTLSATPIPRTLNMAMGGLRDMSTLEAPPFDRRPVATYVVEFDVETITRAIQKELKRGGQIYYLHNNTQTIYQSASFLQKCIPAARIGVGHGQLDESELLEVWRKLLDHEIDIIVCTTIIETGVDVPNCNTLIIENSERFGLSQLHQLRGRVGRTSRRAYAYFTFQKNKSLTEIQQKRLDALREFTKFGAGLHISMRDMELRGAGSVLGKSQSGHMTGVGYEMYVRMIEDAVNAKKNGTSVENKGNSVYENSCEIDIKIDAYIPKNYISSETDRIYAYRRIATARSKDELLDVADEFIDRYGDFSMMSAVCNLFETVKIRLIAEKIKIKEITHKNGKLFLIIASNFDIQSLRFSTVKFNLDFTHKDKPTIIINTTDEPKNQTSANRRISYILKILGDFLNELV